MKYEQYLVVAPKIENLSLKDVDRLDLYFYQEFNRDKYIINDPVEEDTRLMRIIGTSVAEGFDVSMEEVLNFLEHWNAAPSRPLVIYDNSWCDEGSLKMAIDGLQFPIEFANEKYRWAGLSKEQLQLLAHTLNDGLAPSPMEQFADSLATLLFDEDDIDHTEDAFHRNLRSALRRTNEMISSVDFDEQVPYYMEKKRKSNNGEE